MAQIAYVALGIVLVAGRAPKPSFTASLTAGVIIGLVVAGVAGGIFLFLQRRGMWITEKLAPRWLPQTLSHATAFAGSLETIHKTPLRIATSMSSHFAGWIASAMATWIALRLIAIQVGVSTMAPLLGLGPEIGLAVSLLKRARDIAIGVPVLLMWQAMEGKRDLAPETTSGNYLKS